MKIVYCEEQKTAHHREKGTRPCLVIECSVGNFHRSTENQQVPHSGGGRPSDRPELNPPSLKLCVFFPLKDGAREEVSFPQD